MKLLFRAGGLLYLYKGSPPTQMLLVMKMTLLLLTVACLQISARTSGQTITLSEKDAPLETIFKKIERQSGYHFFYRYEWLKDTKRVSIDVKNISLIAALDICFKDQPVSYIIVEKNIAVKLKQNATINSNEPAAITDVKGKITNEKGEPIAGATVMVKGTSQVSVTNDAGEFSFAGITINTIIQVSSVGYLKQEINVGTDTDIKIVLKLTDNNLTDISILLNDGFQAISPERATGSFSFVDNKLINRRISTNILDRIENLATGVSFKNAEDGLLIRGRNSIFSNVSPLIVVDNFPYDGSISNINPNDVENITILKDAAAASIWGARAGNGVIVITTKKGKSSTPQVSFNSNVTMQQRPKLFSMPIISSSDAIDVEKKLFEQGYYDFALVNTISPGPLSPIVEILAQQKDGVISIEQADQQINALRSNDVRSDLSKYFYRKSMLQQHSVNVSGNTSNINYYMSAGFDRNLNDLVGNELNRITLRSRNTFKLTRKLQLDAGINYVQNDTKVGGNNGIYGINSGSKGLYPYADIVDDNGNPLILARNYRLGYTDTAGGGKIMDWKYRPLDEVGSTTTTSKIRDYILNAAIRYQLFPSFQLEAKYQYHNSITNYERVNGTESYYTRDLINRFYQPDATNAFPVPKGDILYLNNSQITSHQGRLQASYEQVWKSKHEVNALAGWEIRDLTTTSNGYQMYGYTPEGSYVNGNLDFVTWFPQFNYGELSQYFTSNVPNQQSVTKTLDRFLSYYANASYSYDNRYIISLSGRNDATNLFGVSTNQKGVGLWSAGIRWKLNNEKFYKISWLPYLSIRATYGYNGNYSRLASAKTTATFVTNEWGVLSASLQNPPNKNLRWEQVRIANFGVDFSSKNGRLSGSMEYYNKHNKDLMARAPIDPTLGVIIDQSNTFFGNVASIKGEGVEIVLNTKNITGEKWEWNTALLFSYAFTKITDYLLPATSSAERLSGSSFNTIVGKPVFTLYSYPSAGLDPETGEPRGYLGKEISKDYYNILSKTKTDSLIYNGPIQAPYFGAFRNRLSYANFSLSVNISYRFGYSFRSTSILYGALIGSWTGHSDYANRWKNPGDELTTFVPSLPESLTSFDYSRDRIYELSNVLVEKGDQIRLEDIRLDYNLTKHQWNRLPFQQITIYAYAANIGLIWTANKRDIDPNYPDGLRPGKSIALGLNISL